MAPFGRTPGTDKAITYGRGRLFGGALGKLLFILILAAIFIYPALMLFFGALNDGLPGTSSGWSFDKLVAAWGASNTYVTLLNSIVIAVGGTVMSGIIGAFFAWISTSTNVPGRQILTPVMVLSMMLPPLFYGFGWVMLANKQTGLFNFALQHWFGVSGSPFNVESWAGLILLSGLGFSPFAYMLLVGAFKNRDRSMDEASRISGAGTTSTLFRITLPSIAPALTGVLALMVVLNLQSFDVPQLIGRPAGIFVFSTEIYRKIYDFSPSDYGSAYSLSIMILLIVIILFVSQRLALRNRNFTTLSGKGVRQEPQKLSRGRYILTAAIVAFTLINLILPGGAVLLGSLEPVFGVHGHFTLANFIAIFQDSQLLASLRLTAMLSVFGGLIAVAIALITSYVVLRRRGFLRSYTSLAVWMPWAMPGVVLALAYLWIVLSTPGLKSFYGTKWLMLAVLVIATIPLVSRLAEGALSQISPELEEAARISGARPTRVLVGIVFRLVLPSFAAGWFLAGLFISGNLAVPAMLSSPVAKPVATMAYELYARGETAKAAALFLIIVAIALVILVLAGIGMAILRMRDRRKTSTRPLAVDELVEQNTAAMAALFPDELPDDERPKEKSGSRL